MWAAQAIGQAFARSELDGVALAAAAATMVIVGIAAGVAPARHAARTDPLLALRGE
jgi:ABC-type antimicrobial peptide transport system permease subunit